MSSQIDIRMEMKADYDGITAVNDLAFGRTNEGLLVLALREIESFEPRLSLIAELDGEIIGHALFTPITIHCAESDYPTLSLGPIAVLQEHQKSGVGGMLITAGHQKAVELGYTSVVLLGHPCYYPRFGYRMGAIWGLTNPWGIHNEAFMAIELVKGSLESKAGLVVYPEAFNQAT